MPKQFQDIQGSTDSYSLNKFVGLTLFVSAPYFDVN